MTKASPEKGEEISLPRELNHVLEETAGPLHEYIFKAILRLHGIPTVKEKIISDEAECKDIATQLGFPLVMKGLQKGKVHKTELGLVHLNITTPEAALQVFDALKKKMGPSGQVLAYRQVEGKIEMIAGLVRDSQF